MVSVSNQITDNARKVGIEGVEEDEVADIVEGAALIEVVAAHSEEGGVAKLQTLLGVRGLQDSMTETSNYNITFKSIITVF